MTAIFGLEVSQAESEALRSIGFHVSYDNCTPISRMVPRLRPLEEKLQDRVEDAVPWRETLMSR